MSAEKHPSLREQAAALPLLPGVYQFVDPDGTVLYVGKAKALRKRVANYFAESRLPSKIRVMVRRAAEIRHIVTGSETDALLLENSLIKTLQPRFNAMLKDDKTYPWIVLRREPFPRIQSTRRIVRDGSSYFGPYASIGVQRNLLEILHTVFGFRTCKLDLSPESISRHRYRPCLEFHLGNCRGPCAGHQSEQQYSELVEMARAMLRGELGPIRRSLSAAMREAASELRFEDAAALKHRLDLLEGYSSRSVIVSPSLGDLDVFALVSEPDEETAFCNFSRIRSGAVTGSFSVPISLGAEQDPRRILTASIQQIAERLDGPLSRNIIVPSLPETELFPENSFSVPRRGEKLALLEFAARNARLFRAEQLKNLEIRDPEKATDRVLGALQRELRLPAPPRWIECFDNSNLGGTHPVAACVVFRDGRPARKEYRHFNVKTVSGPDDFASMREIIYRRYSRLLAEGDKLPDLVVVDGGKGQLSAAAGVFSELGIAERVPLVALAERLEEVFFPGDPEPYYLKRGGEPLRVLMHIRDEAHRFGITFHRNKRSSDFIRSELEQIPGIGPKTITALLREFKTVSAVRAAALAQNEDTAAQNTPSGSFARLASLVGASRAAAVRAFYQRDSTASGT